jgi:putative ABC transport system permease protein
MLWTLFGAVGFVLVIACANVAALLLARGTSRAREFAVRAAVGAGRLRLVRQLLAESLVLAAAGGALGVLLAKWGLSALSRVNPLFLQTNPTALYLPGSGDIHLDGVVLGFSVAVSILTGVLFGLFPSLQISRPDLAVLLRRTPSHPVALNTRSLLVVGQVALSIVLLIGAALLMQSFARLHSVDPGFRPAKLLTARMALPPARYDTDAKRAAFYGALLPRLEDSPALTGAAMAMTLPTTSWIRTNITSVDERRLDPSDPASFGVLQAITPGYFRALGILLKRGREFAARDNTPGAAPVMIVNETLARRLWPDGTSGVGKHVGEGYDKALGRFEVVGVAADIHEGGLASAAVAEFYVPMALHPPQTAYLVARTKGQPMTFAGTLREIVMAADRDQSISEVRTMDAVLDATLGQRRATVVLLGSFAGVAVLLALIGIYGVIAYSVAQRTQEIGIRRALGAQRVDILRLVVGQGLVLAVGGGAIGIGGAFALTRVIKGLLFGVSATDLGTFVGVAGLFIGVALVACLIPAYRAARVEPMAALRME